MTAEVESREASQQERRAAGELRWAWDHEDGCTPAYERDEFVSPFAAWVGAHRDSHTCWVAVAGAAVVGMAFLVRTPRPPRPATGERFVAEIQSVYVRSSHRGEGVGGKLMTTLIEQARSGAAGRMIVHSRPRSRALYERAGFAQVPLLLERDL